MRGGGRLGDLYLNSSRLGAAVGFQWALGVGWDGGMCKASKERLGQENKQEMKEKIHILKKTLSREVQPGSTDPASIRSGCWDIRQQSLHLSLVLPTASLCFCFRCVGL